MLGAGLGIGPGGVVWAEGAFYGGVSMRDNGAESTGLALSQQAPGQTLIWNRFATLATDESTQRSLVYGGYRLGSDVAVEAAFNSTDKYALRPSTQGLSSGPGLGLSFGDVTSRTWNADVYTSWEVIRRLSLYGRLGYAQSDAHPLFAGASLVPDPRRQRDGVNYGVGLRYDVTHSLGLRVEYARFGRFAGELVGPSGMPESDQVSIGVQYRF